MRLPMDSARVIKIVIAIATLATAITCLFGLVWSIAAGQPVILPVVFSSLLVAFGFFLRNDYFYFFGKKNDTTKTQV